jgi:FkbM family methyltransferase
MIALLKLYIAKFITNDLLSRLIAAIYSNKIPHGNFRIDTSNALISPNIKAMIFWKIYESAEIRFIKKYIDDTLDIVELGASIGVVSTYLGSRKGEKKMYNIEVNPGLISVIEYNLKLNGITNFSVLNMGIGVSGSSLYFDKGKYTTHGSISGIYSEGALKIKLKSLSDLLNEKQIGNYALVCDIEGSEIDILLNDPNSLNRCKIIIIETHTVVRNGKSYTPDDIKSMVLAQGFELTEELHNNYVFKRT